MDSSALVKRYISEIGTNWIQALSDPDSGNLLTIARITWVEVRSAIARRQREGSLTQADVEQLIETFRSDLETQYQVVELDATLAESAGQLVSQYPLRAYDAVQLASAIRLQTDLADTSSMQLLFLTADNRLSAIAQTVGLSSDNPNHHL